MKGVVITTKNTMYIKDLEKPILESVNQVVSGPSENLRPMFLPDPYCMLVNEEGLKDELDLNFTGCMLYGTALHECPIVGDIVILKLVRGKEGFDFAGLTDTDIDRVCQYITKVTRGQVKKIADRN